MSKLMDLYLKVVNENQDFRFNSKKELEEARKCEEELKGSQHKLDVNKNEKIDAEDLKKLRSMKEEEELDEAAYHDADFVEKSARHERLYDYHKRMGNETEAAKHKAEIDKLYKKGGVGSQAEINRLNKEDLNLEDFSLEELQDFMVSEDFEQLDELSKATLANYVSKSAIDIYGKGMEKATHRSPQKARAAVKRIIGVQKAAKKLATEEVEQIDELSKKTLGNYISKAAKYATGAATNAMHHRKTSDDWSRIAGDRMTHGGDVTGAHKAAGDFAKYSYDATEKQIKREKGIDKAVKKLTKEETEQLDELSKKTLGSYIKKASGQSTMAGQEFGQSPRGSNAEKKSWNTIVKRAKGIPNAVNKLTSEELEEMTQAQMDKREEYVKGMKKNYKDFVSKYGKRAKDVMYATATKMAMKEETEELEEDLNLEDFSLEELQDFMVSEDFEQLDEISQKVLGSYVQKAKVDYASKRLKGDDQGAEKRRAGVKKAQIKLHKGEDDGRTGITEEELLDSIDEEVTYITEGMIDYGDFMDKVSDYKKAGINVVSHNHSKDKAHIITVGKDGMKRKINFKPSGTSMENLGAAEEGKKPKAEPEAKRGRGRPAGSKSGARNSSSDSKEYGGLAVHSLNLPKSK